MKFTEDMPLKEANMRLPMFSSMNKIVYTEKCGTLYSEEDDKKREDKIEK